MRSYNIRICIVLQGLSQLKAIYEKTYDSIIGNCDTFTLLGSKDKDTLDYISDKLGKITVRNDSRSFNRGGNSGGGGSDTEGFGERPLLYPNEIKAAIKPRGESKKYGGNAIIFVGYENPMFLPKYDTLSHPLFSKCGSKYSEYVQNCTYVEKEYAEVLEKRKIFYEELYSKFDTESKAADKQQADKEAEMEAQHQSELEQRFNDSNQIKPSELPQNEEEYNEYIKEADRSDYDPVDDYADDPDSMYDDIAPVTKEYLN